VDELKKSEQRSHECVELRGDYVNTFFSNPIGCCFLCKAKDLSVPLHRRMSGLSVTPKGIGIGVSAHVWNPSLWSFLLGKSSRNIYIYLTLVALSSYRVL
jgi:hypothetical protein